MQAFVVPLSFRLVADRAPFHVAREGADGVLVLDVELLYLKPVGNAHLLLSCGRTVA
jgi:hypothetical protein